MQFEHPFIKLFPEMLPRQDCEQIIERFLSDSRKYPGRVLYQNGQSEPDVSIKISTDLNITGLPGWGDIDQKLIKVVWRSVERYREEVPNFCYLNPPYPDTGYQMQWYKAGTDNQFKWHVDAGNHASCGRFLAMILYLNDVKDGGSTEFLHQKINVQPEAGSILWFPPGFEYVHRGNPPISNDKFIITTFLDGNLHTH
jgi:hypothetical protein